MKRYLSKILILTFLFSCVITTGLIAMILEMRPVNDNSCDMSGILYGISIGFIVVMTVGTTTIFLNLYKEVRDSYFYSLISFLFIPLTIALISIICIGDFRDGRKEYSAIFIPFLSLLTIYFLKFRKSKFITN